MNAIKIRFQKPRFERARKRAPRERNAAGQKLKGANAKFRKIPEITERIRAISERS